MLRWCFSGLFLFALAVPPCGDFSRAKLRPGGPKPLRTPEFPFRVPGLSGRDQQCVEASRTLLQRVVQILLAVFSTGGRVCLEQPSSAFSWQDPSVQDFLAETAAVCSVVPACSFGLNIHKKWLCASSLQDMSQLAGTCRRASWEHENLAGKRDEWGGFCTQQSAVYPDGLCETIVQIIRPLFPLCEPPFDASAAHLSDCVPKKGVSDPPHAFQDGAGIHSIPDWSVPPSTAKPLPGSLRHSLLQWLSDHRIPTRLQWHVQSSKDSPLFTTDELGSFAPSSALGFSQLLALFEWIGQCPRGSRTVSTLCNA